MLKIGLLITSFFVLLILISGCSNKDYLEPKGSFLFKGCAQTGYGIGVLIKALQEEEFYIAIKSDASIIKQTNLNFNENETKYIEFNNLGLDYEFLCVNNECIKLECSDDSGCLPLQGEDCDLKFYCEYNYLLDKCSLVMCSDFKLEDECISNEKCTWREEPEHFEFSEGKFQLVKDKMPSCDYKRCIDYVNEKECSNDTNCKWNENKINIEECDLNNINYVGCYDRSKYNCTQK